jgi:RNA polymerase sigma factor (TIGR02999 family)
MSNASPRSGEVTAALDAIREGDRTGQARLLALVYDELRRVARRMMARESAGQTLQPTALVHEAYLRLFGNGPVSWENRAHFFVAAATTMRRILVERARRRGAERHGGKRRRVTLDEGVVPADSPASDLLALEESLRRLEAEDERACRVVHLRYFAGLGIEETAELMGLSTATVSREWTYARAWLLRDMRGLGKGGPDGGQGISS